jgi:hypothetical protein
MTVRRNRRKRNARGLPDSGSSPDGSSPLLTLRSAFILTVAVIVAAAAGVLTYLTTGSAPGAVFAAGPAIGAAIPLLNAIVGR